MKKPTNFPSVSPTPKPSLHPTKDISEDDGPLQVSGFDIKEFDLYGFRIDRVAEAFSEFMVRRAQLKDMKTRIFLFTFQKDNIYFFRDVYLRYYYAKPITEVTAKDTVVPEEYLPLGIQMDWAG